jgi:hypothetical protein
MADVSTTIPIIFESRIVKTDEDLRSDTRFVINRISAAYESDADLSLYLYFRRSDAMSWESIGPFTLDKDIKRFDRVIYPVKTVIDYYVKITGSITSSCDITSCRVWQKIKKLGKHQYSKPLV